ncbi:hemolysin family protein [Jatrophihabitans sp. YIM 134969]
MPDWLGILLTFVLLLGNGFFVGAEFALVSARRSVIEPMVDAGSRRAGTTLHAMERVSLMLAGAQLGITICSLLLGSLSEPAIAHLLEPVFEGLHIPEGVVHPISFVLALALVTVLHVVIGEMVPKNIALAAPEKSALLLGPPLNGVVTGLKPIIASFNWIANHSLRLVGVTPRDEVASVFTRDEVAGMVAESHREGLLEQDDRELLEGAISFEDRTASAVVLPVADLLTVGPGVTPDGVEMLAVASGFSRFPFVRDDEMVGYVHVKDVLTLPDRDDPLPAELVRRLPDVRCDQPLRTVLEAMRAEGSHLVRARDASGATVGVVAMEDVLEELVGEIRA